MRRLTKAERIAAGLVIIASAAVVSGGENAEEPENAE